MLFKKKPNTLDITLRLTRWLLITMDTNSYSNKYLFLVVCLIVIKKLIDC